MAFRLSYSMRMVSIRRLVWGISMQKPAICIFCSLPVIFSPSLSSLKPEECSSRLIRLIDALMESFWRAFNEMLAMILRRLIWLTLNFPGVSFSDKTLYETLPRRSRRELILKLRFVCLGMVSLDANVSTINWKFGSDCGVAFSRLAVKPNNWMLLMEMRPWKVGEYRILQKNVWP